jgi:hypothetical protein
MIVGRHLKIDIPMILMILHRITAALVMIPLIPRETKALAIRPNLLLALGHLSASVNRLLVL